MKLLRLKFHIRFRRRCVIFRTSTTHRSVHSASKHHGTCVSKFPMNECVPTSSSQFVLTIARMPRGEFPVRNCSEPWPEELEKYQQSSCKVHSLESYKLTQTRRCVEFLCWFSTHSRTWQSRDRKNFMLFSLCFASFRSQRVFLDLRTEKNINSWIRPEYFQVFYRRATKKKVRRKFKDFLFSANSKFLPMLVWHVRKWVSMAEKCCVVLIFEMKFR